jgi:biopolymer transport protein ExbD
MFTRPSARRKSKARAVELNLVPILDTLITLIAFLLFTSAFIGVAFIDTPVPLLSAAEEQIKKIDEKPLQLTAHVQENQIFVSDWTGSRENHRIPNIPGNGVDSSGSGPQYDLERLHQILVEIKLRHPKETKLILKPQGGVSYEALVGIMDAARSFQKTDPPLYVKNALGVDTVETKLFSEVIFGNIMSP